MIQLTQILDALTPPVAQHSNAAAPDPASPEPAYAPSAKDDIDTWYRDLDKAWFYYRAEKDPRLKRQLDALINAIKNPGSGVVKPK